MKRQGRRHHDLKAWRDAMDLVEEVYRITTNFPTDERYALKAQIRRAAVSIPSNIAEGAAKGTKKEFRRALHMARGSLSETETQLQIAARLGYFHGDKSTDELIDRLFGRLSGLINSLD